MRESGFGIADKECRTSYRDESLRLLSFASLSFQNSIGRERRLEGNKLNICGIK